MPTDVIAIIRTLLDSALFSAPPEELPPAALARAHVLLATIDKACAARKKELRAPLTRAVQDSTQITASGGAKATYDAAAVTYTSSLAKEPDYEKFRNVLHAHGLPMKDAYDEVRTLRFNPSKAERLVELGYIAREDLDACRRKTERLTVRATKKFKKELG